MYKKKAFKLSSDMIIGHIKSRIPIQIPESKTLILTMFLVKIGIDQCIISLILMFI